MHPIVEQKIADGHCICAPRGLSIAPRCPIHDPKPVFAEQYRHCSQCGSTERAHEVDCQYAGAENEVKTRPAPQMAPLGEPVAKVESYTNGSYSRNYKVRWLRDVPEGTFLYAGPAPK